MAFLSAPCPACHLAVLNGSVYPPGLGIHRCMDGRPMTRTAQVPGGLFQLPFRMLARLRGARVFHPVGTIFAGKLRADHDLAAALGTPEAKVWVRLSKALSTPRNLPDFLGFAVRIAVPQGRSWDLALVSTGSGLATRFLPVPTRWSGAHFGSIMLYQIGGSGPIHLVAQPSPGQPGNRDLAAVAAHGRAHGLEFTLWAVSPQGEFRRLATIEVPPGPAGGQEQPEYFDPVLNHPAQVRLLPGWLAGARAAAYAGSRQGRGTLAATP